MHLADVPQGGVLAFGVLHAGQVASDGVEVFERHVGVLERRRGVQDELTVEAVDAVN